MIQIRRSFVRGLVCLTVVSLPLLAQTPLSLKDAIAMALEKHPSVEVAKASEQEAQMRIQQTRSGYLPKLNYQESWARSNNPVFVFSSLLTQHQFTMANFDIATLNRPDFINNFQSLVTVDQAIFDAGQTKHSQQSAKVAGKMVSEERRRTDMDVILNVVRVYSGVLLAKEGVLVAEESVKSAQADLERAQAVRAAGMSTDADVLSIKVHQAAVAEQRIRAVNDYAVAKAALNEALGVPLDSQFDISTPLAASPVPATVVEEFEKQGVGLRPEARQATLAGDLVQEQKSLAKAAFYPQVFFRGAFEADRQQFINKGGANWLAGLTMRWNLYNGSADKYRVEEAVAAERRARAQKQRAESGIRLQVRKAYLDLNSARERMDVTRAAVAMAEEGHRIIQNRYQSGLTTVTELLRSETALLAARVRNLAAIHDQRIATAVLLQAAGTLSKDSEL